MASSSSSMSVTSTNRVIALVDMDCFYVQVEERDDPSIKGVPAAVVQYKAYKGGGIIAVNYEARAKGVTRQMRGDDAKAACPEIQLVRVPETRGKADLTKYRDASREVMNVLTEFSSCVERASIDEAYIDLTEAVENRMSEMSSDNNFKSWQESLLSFLDMESFSTNFVLGFESTTEWFDALKSSEMPSLDDVKLTIGAEIVGKMREAVYRKTNFRCSAGIAHNKVVAKLVCGINKPNKQTMLPHPSVPTLWATTRICKVRGLGGKLGDYLTEKLGCANMSDLNKFTEKQLCSELGSKAGQWIYQLSLGYDDEPVTPRQLPKSVGCNKNFLGPEALRTKEKVKFWISQLAAEVVERVQRDLEMNSRRAKTLTLHVRFEDQNALSRSCGVNPNYNAERMASDAFAIMEKLYQTVGVLPVVSLGLIASKFEDEIDVSGYAKINDFFTAKQNTSSDSNLLDVNADSQRSQMSSSKSVPSKQKSSKVAVNPSGTISRFLVSKEPERPKSIDNSNLANTSNNTSLASSSSSKHNETTDSPLHLLNSPSKTLSNNQDSTPRKAFFSFSSVKPPQSPRKSPRKLTSVPVANTNSAERVDDCINIDEDIVPLVIEKQCERCGKKIDVLDYSSHLDYHFAKDLSREINGLPVPPPSATNSASGVAPDVSRNSSSTTGKTKEPQKRPRGKGRGSSSSKRGRSAKSTDSTSGSSVQFRKINTFFTSQS